MEGDRRRKFRHQSLELTCEGVMKGRLVLKRLLKILKGIVGCILGNIPTHLIIDRQLSLIDFSLTYLQRGKNEKKNS